MHAPRLDERESHEYLPNGVPARRNRRRGVDRDWNCKLRLRLRGSEAGNDHGAADYDLQERQADVPEAAQNHQAEDQKARWGQMAHFMSLMETKA